MVTTRLGGSKLMRRGVVRTCGVLAAVGISALVVSAAQAAVGTKPSGPYQTNGRVEQIVISGNTAYVAGQFTSVRPAGSAAGTGEVTRNHVAAFNVQTGALLPWDPNANNTVQSLVVSGSNVYMGGLFTTVGGHNDQRLAEVDATSGAANTTFKGSTNAQVMDIALSGGVLYAGGEFTQAGSANAVRSHLAAFDPTTGAVTAWAPTADNTVNQVVASPDGSKIYVAGAFGRINNLINSRLAALNPSTGAPLPWVNHPNAAVSSMVADSQGVYVAATGNGGNVTAFNPSTGQQQWIAGTDGNTQALALMGGLVYVGGHFANYCGANAGSNHCPTQGARAHVMALNQTTGALDAWKTSANGTLGVFAVTGANGNIFWGGDFTKFGSITQQGLAEVTTINDPTVTDSAHGQPSNTSVTVTASGSTDSGPGFVGYRYQTSTNGGTTWSANHTGATVTITAVGTTQVRFQAYDSAGNTTNWVTDSVTIQAGGGGGGAVVTFKASGSGSVGTGGNATIKGTYTCNGASSITISGTLTEASNGATGSFSVVEPCPNNTTSTKWQTVAKAGATKFTSGGSASEQVSWAATDLSNNQPIGGSQTVTVTLS